MGRIARMIVALMLLGISGYVLGESMLGATAAIAGPSDAAGPRCPPTC